MKEIEYYVTADGKCPFAEWRNSLSYEFRVRITKRLNRIKDGNFGDWKKLKNSSLSELRLDFGKGYRIFFKEFENTVVIIFAAGDKSNQDRVIKLSENYLNEYLSRGNNGKY